MIEFNSTLTLLKLVSGKGIEVNQTHANEDGTAELNYLGLFPKCDRHQ